MGQAGRDLKRVWEDPWLLRQGFPDSSHVLPLTKTDERARERVGAQVVMSQMRRKKTPTPDNAGGEARSAGGYSFERVLRAAPDGILILDPSAKILHVNPAAEALFGAAPGELVGTLVHSWIKSDVLRPERRAASGNEAATLVREALCVRVDGSNFPAEITCNHPEDGDPCVVIVRECSAGRRIEREILENSEAIRRGFGRDLHDGLGQLLTGVAFLAHGLTRDVPDNLRPRVERLTTLANSAIRRTHEIAEGLAPALPDGVTLSERLSEFARATSDTYGVACVFESQGDFSDMPPERGIQVFLIAQEGIMNAVRHARCQHIRVELTRQGPLHSLTVTDDGVGLSGDLPAGLGIRSMGYRARVLGGRLELLARSDGPGLEVRCRFQNAN